MAFEYTRWVAGELTVMLITIWWLIQLGKEGSK